MRRATSWLLCLGLLLSATPATARIVLVGIDGGSWNVIDPMLAAGELPHLAGLVSRGVSAELETVEPLRSPVVWTSIATGRSPEVHGVGDFFATALRIQAPTVFERLAAKGLRVGLYDYLVTWPPASLPGGFVIPGWLRRDDSVTPADVWSRIPFSPFVNAYYGAKTNADYLARAHLEVREKAKRWNALASAFAIQVGAVTFYAADATSHRFWQARFPEDLEEEADGYSAAERTAIPRALRGIDHSIGKIVSAMSPSDTILIASDHGFQAVEDGVRSVWVSHVERALVEAGLDADRDGFRLISSFGAVTLRVRPGEFAERDATTNRLLELLDSFGSADGTPLFSTTEVIDIAPRPPEAARSWLGRLRQWVLRLVVRHVFGVSLDETAHASVFALPDDELLESLWPDAEVRVGERTLPLSRAFSRQRFSGAHHPTAVFAAAGGPIGRREERGTLSVLDIAPLLFYLAGQGIPDDLEGELPIWLIAPDQLKLYPPRPVLAAQAPGIERVPKADDDGEADSDLLEKLRALGYLE